MHTTKYLGARATLAAALMLAVIFLVLVAHIESAEAAFPGANGKIVFNSNRTTGEGVDNPTGDLEIFTMNKDTTGLTQLTNNTTSDGAPSFSGDGSTIVFTSQRDGNSEIYTMDSDGSDQTRRTDNTSTELSPTISHDETKIAYSSNRDGNFEIYLMENGVETNLTKNNAVDGGTAFSPDGTKIAFTTNRDGGNSEIYTMDTDPDTNDATNLSNNAASDSSPDWSPNGQKIAFSSVRNSNNDVYVMDADGSSERRLTKN